MQDAARRTLVELVNTHGPALIDDPRRLEGLLRDHASPYRREIAVLVSAAREGVPRELQDPTVSVPGSVRKVHLAQRLEDDLAISHDAACWAVEAWAEALGLAPSPAIGSAAGSAKLERSPEPARSTSAASRSVADRTEAREPVPSGGPMALRDLRLWALVSGVGWMLGPVLAANMNSLTSDAGVEGGIIGAVGGASQFLLLRRVRAPRAGWWLTACAIGWGLGFAGLVDLGMSGPAWLLPLLTLGGSSSAVAGWILAGIAAGAGFGVTTGVCQWLVLRERTARAGSWMGVSVASWAIAGLVVGATLGFDWFPLRSQLTNHIWSEAGAIGGALTGAALPLFIGMVKLDPRPDDGSIAALIRRYLP